jgi:hypothetical protein
MRDLTGQAESVGVAYLSSALIACSARAAGLVTSQGRLLRYLLDFSHLDLCLPVYSLTTFR